MSVKRVRDEFVAAIAAPAACFAIINPIWVYGIGPYLSWEDMIALCSTCTTLYTRLNKPLFLHRARSLFGGEKVEDDELVAAAKYFVYLCRRAVDLIHSNEPVLNKARAESWIAQPQSFWKQLPWICQERRKYLPVKTIVSALLEKHGTVHAANEYAKKCERRQQTIRDNEMRLDKAYQDGIDAALAKRGMWSMATFRILAGHLNKDIDEQLWDCIRFVGVTSSQWHADMHTYLAHSIRVVHPPKGKRAMAEDIEQIADVVDAIVSANEHLSLLLKKEK